jgi:chemotaxis protein methyltransferase CheR
MRRQGASVPPMVLEAAAALVRRRTGLAFAGCRASAFESGLLKAMHAEELSDPALYLARLEGEASVLDALVADITVGETHFFRDLGQWGLIRSELLPPLLARRPPHRPLRVWSAGCASGEEPYTAAIVLHQIGAAEQAQIVGTDMSRPALAAARRAQYTRWSLRGVSDEIVQLYFRLVGRRFELAPAIRQAVEFRYQNLAAADSSPNPGLRGMDLVLCRNVLIYFDADSLPRVVQRLLDSLSEDGWLVLGASDPLIAGMVECEVQVTSTGLVYRRPRGRPSEFRNLTSLPASSTQAAKSTQPRLQPAVPPARPVSSILPIPPESSLPSVSDAEGEVKRVRALVNRGDLAEAGRACAAALDRHRTSAELTYLHAVLLLEAGHPAEAAKAGRLALYLDRGLVVAHLVLGDALARLGRIEDARRALRNAQRLLAVLGPQDAVPASDGEPAGRLAEMARAQMELLERVGR